MYHSEAAVVGNDVLADVRTKEVSFALFRILDPDTG